MLQIGSKSIGCDVQPYIIAEIGVNHDGSVDTAMSMVAAAAKAGADAVKLQYFKADMLMSKACKLAEYQSDAGELDPVEMLSRLELSLDEMSQIIDLAHVLNIHAIVSIFSVELVERAIELPWNALKSASPDIINIPLLREMNKSKLPLIVSTGAADADEIRNVIEPFASALLHCVSSYPTPMHVAQLAGINALHRLVCEVKNIETNDQIPVGYSDHTADVHTGGLAVIAGASILEKHFTNDCNAVGPDHKTSLDSHGLSEYIQFAHKAWRSLGNNSICVQDIENDVRTVSRQSVTMTRSLETGTILTSDDLTIQRPGTGIAPRYYDALIGCTLKNPLAAHMPVNAEDIVEGIDDV